MAPSSFHFLSIFFLISFLLILTSESKSQPTTFKPNKLVLPVQKDRFTHLFVTNVHKRTPLKQVPFVVHLNGQFLWVTCEQNYLSTTYHAPFCHSTQCARANTPYCHTSSSRARPGCHNNTCGLMALNPVTRQAAMAELAQDVLSIQSTNGVNLGPFARVPNFLFACAPSFLLQKGFPKNVQGIAGLGHAPISLPTQLASHFGFPPKFALCLPSSYSSNGAMFFGDGPYFMGPGMDVSRQLSFTPLTISREGKYYIGVTSIRVNNKPVPINRSLLKFNANAGTGGTKISTIKPFTVLEHSIYQSFTKFFTSQLSGIPQLKPPVPPFRVCYDSRKLSNTKLGPGVPNIDFVLQNQNVKWTISGANSMVQARPGVTCLAFVDGGFRPRASIIIGSHQMQDNLLQFDLAGSRLGFSSSLLFRRTTCGNFNFSTAATP
ncbi:basic 7S globulin-like [Melia azedarach]|uniref:Basic 7S globulin-like n=1 Tax=Melia azedarach TaxID=155640 RepID=A0ACC1Y7S5_MELAZ|nr:basic 7S globulin-like [Melia azedarach]